MTDDDRDPASAALEADRRALLRGALLAPLVCASPAMARALGDPGPSASPLAPGEALAIDAGQALLPAEEGRHHVRSDITLVVRDGQIEAVRTGAAKGVRTIDARGLLVLPGFISGHTHGCSATPTRGIIEGGRSFARPLELVESLPAEQLDALTAYNVAELLLSGATTHVEMSLSLRQAQSYVRVARRWGVRCYPGGMVPGIARLFPIWFRQDDQVLFDSEADTLREIADNLAFAESVNGVDDGRIRPQMTPHAADTQTPATMAAFAAAARKLGHGVHTHLSQSARETATVRRLHGMTPTEWFQAHGMLAAGPFFGAHMVGLDLAVDAPLLREAGAVYAHCPSAGGAGGPTQPYPEALAAGLAVNIGIDTHSNDYVENLKLAVLYGQARHSLLAEHSAAKLQRPTIDDAVAGATRVAADGLRRPDLGRLAPGARADLVGIDVTSPLVGVGARPPEPLHHLLYANGSAVRLVMTDGQLQVNGGRFLVDDLSRVVREGGRVVSELWARLGREGWLTQ
ncbi:MAG: amidohydrolase family protein [Pseudomonadota bacterium]